MASGNTFDPMLFNSILNGDLERLMHCLQNGGRVGPQGLTPLVADLVTPLVAAAKNGHTDICGLLLAHGANVNEVEDDSKLTPLHYAASIGNGALVEALLSWGAKVDAPDLEGRTPLYGACQEGHLACVTALLKAGGSFSFPAKDGSLPIHVAAQNNKIDVVATVLELGCGPNVVSYNEIMFHQHCIAMH